MVSEKNLDMIKLYMLKSSQMRVTYRLYLGFGDMNNPNSSIRESLNDVKRVEYMKNYLDALAAVIRY